MSQVDQFDAASLHDTTPVHETPASIPLPPPAGRPLHRLRLVRQRERLSRRALARRMKTDIESVIRQEDEATDLTLSILYQWQEALGVPIAELLVEADDGLSPPVLWRTQMIRLMKTAQSILEQKSLLRVRRLAQNLVDQFLEIMPELKDVGPWPLVGQRRTLAELGAAVRHFIPAAGLMEPGSCRW